MKKKLQNWFKLKDVLTGVEKNIIFLKKRQIWWCFVWENLWNEMNWKWEKFLRPVLILKVLNKNSFVWIPLTSQFHEWTFFYEFQTEDIDSRVRNSYALLNQIKVFSNKRLDRIYCEKINLNDFEKIKKKLYELLWILASK